jgi:hypothetical protein
MVASEGMISTARRKYWRIVVPVSIREQSFRPFHGRRMEAPMDMLILASRLLARKYPLPNTRRSVLSLAAAFAVILVLVAALNVASRSWKSESLAGDHGGPLRVSAESP